METTAMKRCTLRNSGITWVFLFGALIIELITGLAAAAQNPDLQQNVAKIKEAVVSNKQDLAQYTWLEQVTISIKGEQKKGEHFQVRVGPDGKPQKTSLDPPSAADSDGGGRRSRVKEHIVEKKKEEYKDYADQIKSLVQQYVPPEKDLLSQAYQQGNITLGPEAGAPEQYRLVISNYIKKGDNMTLLVAKGQGLEGMSIASYLDDPKDAVNVLVQFGAIPGGPNHVSQQTIKGVRKQLTIVVQNSNYQHL
jgi:23S rRNA pseudoU1915 N3-methylase RlmH